MMLFARPAFRISRSCFGLGQRAAAANGSNVGSASARFHATPALHKGAAAFTAAVARRRNASTVSTPGSEEAPQRYGPLDVDLKPRDQLRPLLPTWNPPPTRPPQPDELELSTRLRLELEGRWWAATVREVGEAGGAVKVGYDGWPGRHDEMLPRESDRLYLHESFHAEYEAPPLPKRFQRPALLDGDGNPLPVAPRAPRPKVYDPEKERMKRALRPPLPYNPEKERLKRVLRGQYAPPVEDTFWQPPEQRRTEPDLQPAPVSAKPEQPQQTQTPQPTSVAAPAVVPAQLADPVDWVEVTSAGTGQAADSARSFRNPKTGEIRNGAPTSGWVELVAEGGSRYYWNVDSQLTQWVRPQ